MDTVALDDVGGHLYCVLVNHTIPLQLVHFWKVVRSGTGNLLVRDRVSSVWKGPSSGGTEKGLHACVSSRSSPHGQGPCCQTGFQPSLLSDVARHHTPFMETSVILRLSLQDLL